MDAFLPNNDSGIAEAARLLRAGACVAVPTETVYGLAAHARNESAVRQVFAIKGRPLLDPLIIHVHHRGQLRSLTRLTPSHEAAIDRLADAFWPGPLTLVLPKSPLVPDLVTAGKPSVAVRCPAHPTMRKLLEISELELAAPSANPFGYISPTSAEHVRDSLGERLPHILDGGPCDCGVESTILDLRDPTQPALLRPGPIGHQELEAVLGTPIRPHQARSDDPALSPGSLPSHYSPGKPLDLHAEGNLPAPTTGTAVIHLKRPALVMPGVYWLSESGSTAEAARHLFALLRQLDADPAIAHIDCERPNGCDAWSAALRDRLDRASR